MSNQWFAKKTIEQIKAQAAGMPLQPVLGRWSLTMLGIGATIGSGIFALTGTAAAGENFQPSIIHAQIIDLLLNLIQHGSVSGTLMHGRPPAGPAIVLSFALCAIVCGLVGLCYAELASMIPFAGGAYNYTYVSMGEALAWIAGWGLILEFVVGNVAVAASFAGYLREQLIALHLTLPEKWSTPVWSAGRFTGSYFNIPAFAIIILLTLLVIQSVERSARSNNILVSVKIVAILIFLAVGATAVSGVNLRPFAPSGLTGILGAGAIVFFSYIGFESVSNAAEEAKNVKHVPFALGMALIACALLYIAVAFVLLGMVTFSKFGDGQPGFHAPVLYALKQVGAWTGFQVVIVIGALVGMASALLAFQFAQARLWFAMSRDCLLPRALSYTHPRFKSPYWAAWAAGGIVAIFAGLMDIGDAADVANIGTLFAFVLVSLGVIILRKKDPKTERQFKVPLVPWIPLLAIILCGVLMTGLTVMTWCFFVLWLIAGLVVYVVYGRRRSPFADSRTNSAAAATGLHK